MDPSKRLGVNGSDEVMNHPWLSGIDPEIEEPPFIPDSNVEFTLDENTGFGEKYPDIMEDVHQSLKNQDDDIPSFHSVALNQLAKSNQEIFKKNRRSPSFDGAHKGLNSLDNSPLRVSPLLEEEKNSPSIIKSNMASERRRTMSPYLIEDIAKKLLDESDENN